MPGRGVVEDDDRVDGGKPEVVVGGEPGHPFHPEQVVPPRCIPAAEMRRHGMYERPGGARVDADLRRQLGTGDEGGERQFREGQALVQAGHGSLDILRREVAQ